MKKLLSIILTAFLFSCANDSNNKEEIFYQHYKSAIDTYGVTLFSHFPDDLPMVPKKSNNFSNAMFRLEIPDTVTTQGRERVEPLFLFYGEQMKKEEAFIQKVESLAGYGSIKVKKRDPLSFYVFDFKISSEEQRLCPYFSRLKDDGIGWVNDTLTNNYIKFNTEVGQEKKFPVPLLADTIVLINELGNFILSEDLTCYVIDSKEGVFYDNIDKINDISDYCFPSNWEHGFSRGYFLSKQDQYILYWLLIW